MDKIKKYRILSRNEIFRRAKIQIDVKNVPQKCLSKEFQEKGEKNYQYTEIDEYSRYVYLCFTNEHDTYASIKFIERVVNAFRFKIKKYRQIIDLNLEID